MTRNFAITTSALILFVVALLFDGEGPLPAAADAVAPARHAQQQVPTTKIAASFGSESDRFEEPAEPEPDEGLAEEDTIAPAVQAYGVTAHFDTVPAPLRGTITGAPRIE